MTKEEKQIVKNVKVKLSWTPFWIAGFLFTLGYVGVDPVLDTYPAWKQVLIWIGSYWLWPLILGDHLSG